MDPGPGCLQEPVSSMAGGPRCPTLRSRDMTLTYLLLLLPLLSFDPRSCKPDGFDPLTIEWELPGQFEHARARSLKEERLLLIKGVSFGIDRVGAVCATKGDW